MSLMMRERLMFQILYRRFACCVLTQGRIHIYIPKHCFFFFFSWIVSLITYVPIRTNNSLKMGLMVTFSPNFISEGKMRDEAVADQI